MPITRCASLALCVVAGASASAPAQSVAHQAQLPTLEQKLREVRYELHVEGAKFSGSGAPVLATAIADAHYVLIGEDRLLARAT